MLCLQLVDKISQQHVEFINDGWNVAEQVNPSYTCVNISHS